MGGSTPSADPRIGEAALRSADLGDEYLSFMKDQSKITNAWAETDRDRYQSEFVPLQDQFIEEARGYDTPERREERVSQARADVSSEAGRQQGSIERNLSSMGIDPRSGRAATARARGGVDTALARAGASNMARRSVETEGRGLRAQAINLGNGLAVNPATSQGLSSSAAASGFQGAMQGQQQAGNLLNTQYQQQLQSANAKNSIMGGIGGALGNVFGAAGGMAMFSSKDYKENGRGVPQGKSLEAVRQMPVEEWSYKEGIDDGGEHVGTYAEDFQAATGKGDGKTIPIVDAIGTLMGAVKDLDAKVSSIGGRGVPSNA